jgi:hypothetical protein
MHVLLSLSFGFGTYEDIEQLQSLLLVLPGPSVTAFFPHGVQALNDFDPVFSLYVFCGHMLHLSLLAELL